MLTGHRSAWRRRTQRSRAARIAVPLAIPMALGLTLGVIFAVTSGGHSTQIRQSALGAGASASASASASTTTGATTTVAPAASFANGPVATRQLGDLATAPVSGAAGATPISLTQTAAEAANSMNCTLTVPANPLSTKGLETPYQLGDGCSMANAATEGAFVEATILSPNGQVAVYNPLVITAGTTPQAAPAAAPTIEPGDQVEISIGFNGTNLVDVGPGATQGRCVDALGQSLIGQVSACNAVNFYNLANAEIARGTLKVPPLGTDSGGQTCLDTRNFALIDQDPSDNTVSQYLINGNGQTEQATAANKAADPDDTVLANGSDDTLLGDFVDPANGCTPFQATDTTNPNGKSDSQALNELSSRVNQQGTIAVTPTNDEMVLVDGNFSVAKTNVYRSLVDQPLLANNVNPTTVAADYCQNMVNIAPARNQLDATREANFTSPVPAVGDNLATFMANRLSMSFTNLNCQNFGLANPVNVTLNGAGVAIAATYNTAQQAATGATAATTGAGPGTSGGTAPGTKGTQGQGGRRGRRQDPSGM
jgi:hypothetical protein